MKNLFLFFCFLVFLGGVDAQCVVPQSLTSSVSGGAVTLSWTQPQPFTQTRVYYRKSAVASWHVAGVDSPNASIALSGLSPATNYSWRVRNICGINVGALSATYTFQTAAAAMSVPDVCDHVTLRYRPLGDSIWRSRVVPVGFDPRLLPDLVSGVVYEVVSGDGSAPVIISR